MEIPQRSMFGDMFSANSNLLYQGQKRLGEVRQCHLHIYDKQIWKYNNELGEIVWMSFL